MRTPKIDLPQQWVAPIAVLFLCILIAILELPILQQTTGTLVLPQDEGYNRLAIARNLADHGVWGLSPHLFAGASSSILYPVLMAVLFKILGAHVLISFLINLAAAILFIYSLQRWLQAQTLSPISQLLLLLLIIYLIPLHVMVVIGMEHSLQLFLAFIFVTRFCAWFNSQTKLPILFLLLAFLLTALRYEGLFIIFPACLALLIKRKWIPALLLGLAAALPIILYGLYSLQQGGYFIPNTLIVKAIPLPLNEPRIKVFFMDEIINKLIFPYPTRGNAATNRLLILLPLIFWFYLPVLKEQWLLRHILLFCLAMTALHLVFADTTLFYRYEAYLVACDLVVPGVLIARYGLKPIFQRGAFIRWVAVWTLFFLCFPFFSRSWGACNDTLAGLNHSLLQNYQAGKFLQKYYNDNVVIMDELGLTSFMTPGKKLDPMTGVAFTEVAGSKLDDFTRPEYIEFLMKKEKPVIALISDRKYFTWYIRDWIKVATWTTTYKLAMGDNQLSFYAIDPADSARLTSQLKAFEPSLPKEVKVAYVNNPAGTAR